MLSKWFNKKDSQRLVGLDLGYNSIRIMQINTASKPYRIEKYIISQLASGSVVNGEIKNTQLACQSLKDAFEKANIQNRNIAFSIQRSATVIKNIKIDNRLTLGEIESRAWIEANQHFPDLIGEMYLDFSIENIENSAESDLMLVACRKDQIQPFLALFYESNLVPKVIDVNSYALERAVNIIIDEIKDISTIALLNIDINLTTLLVSHNKKLSYAHDHNFDGLRLMKQTKDYLETSTQNATSLNDVNYNALLKNNLTSHLRHTMHVFYSSRPNIAIQKLVLSGDCANIPCIVEFIQQETGIHTVIANPIQYMTIADDIDKEELQKNVPSLMLAIGLALSKID